MFVDTDGCFNVLPPVVKLRSPVAMMLPAIVHECLRFFVKTLNVISTR